MSNEERVSDERLNAFVDNELDTDEWTRIVEQIRQDPDLARRVCELRQLKDMVCMSYQLNERAEPLVRSHPTGRGRLLAGAATSLMLLLAGLAAGYQLGHGRTSAGFEQLVRVDPAQEDASKILVHIASDDPGRLKAALDETEDLLRDYQARARKVQIEVVANADGVQLLRSDTSPYARRIAALLAKYDNLAFLACSRSLEKLRLRGIDVHLLPEVDVVPGALEEIVARLQEGWVYIKI